MEGNTNGEGGGNAVICGNGPSLKNIDYKRLPKEFDVFRCNQFYFEDRYFVGKNIKYAFFNPFVFFEQYYTSKKLIQNGEYIIENIVCSTFNLPSINDESFIKLSPSYFCDTLLGHEVLSKINDFLAFVKYNEIYENKRMTSGIYMCATAVALGYKNIYLTGIDFYDDNNNMYAFESKQHNMLSLLSNFKNKDSVYEAHSKNFDLETLIFLKEKYNVNFYTLNENSPISKYIDLAPIENSNFILKDKPSNYINDILIPNSKYKNPIHKIQNQLKQNIYYKLFKDLFRLPSDIKHYLKEKYANKNR
ncbi:alpha-2,3 sialyltransferase [Campylobacter jejuni]|uniref:alpha-2,3-sialyltransferase n=1 Tax=Campylobacter jejuni TaxID=197 RepID=UPI000874BF77|nr:alpha-2,3-sialyltransferase [Campylobacter jejuni]OEV44255.1 alpha-2,3 sialyltransferase [Campylobacter jejuni]OEV46790.1 alpha-2,3 sialyltransferase [Campylobacter jejuni]OEV49235.1 alpha-2,3 sialyltransferase [Campylobacter jejuni]OEV64319.1 alpha-2,3 sialyltransferase [Campylobacter jejuni]OEW03665.1 alpha-2,3 sialyltransferase [Campylobacter jejuni]